MHRPRKQGFSLIEIVIAMAIFTFAIVTLLGLMGSSLKVTRDSEERIQAANLAIVIAARYQGMLESEAKNLTVDWIKSPLPQTMNNTAGPFATSGNRFVDALGNATGSADDGVFGIKSVVWQEPWTTSSGAMLVHCSLQLEWPVAAVAANGITNSYNTTTSFVINP